MTQTQLRCIPSRALSTALKRGLTPDQIDTLFRVSVRPAISAEAVEKMARAGDDAFFADLRRKVLA